MCLICALFGKKRKKATNIYIHICLYLHGGAGKIQKNLIKGAIL